jgi:hypothetical protein
MSRQCLRPADVELDVSGYDYLVGIHRHPSYLADLCLCFVCLLHFVFSV